jgi:hypothetical protein
MSRPVARSAWVSGRAPAWNNLGTVSGHHHLGRRAVSCTRKVPFELVRTGLSTSPILPGQRHSSCLNDQVGPTSSKQSPRLAGAAESRSSRSALPAPEQTKPLSPRVGGQLPRQHDLEILPVATTSQGYTRSSGSYRGSDSTAIRRPGTIRGCVFRDTECGSEIRGVCVQISPPAAEPGSKIGR